MPFIREENPAFFFGRGSPCYLKSRGGRFYISFYPESTTKGSRVVYDYLYASVLRRENTYYGEKEIYDTVRKQVRGILLASRNEIERYLDERGFKLIAQLHTFRA
jgi:O-methyltransferase involved in polyketide biosynthesis